MIRKACILALLLSMLLASLNPGSILAQSGIEIADSSAQIDFPSGIDFSLSARNDADITDIRLRYVIERLSYAQVTSEVFIEFEPSTTVDVSWTMEMVKVGGLPPGSLLEYWWVIEDSGGDRFETDPAQIHFDDDRYSWNSLTEGEINIYWYEGGQSFVRELMEVAQQALSRLSEDTGAYLERPVKLYIYANADDLRGSMIYPQEWTGGVSFTRYGTLAIGIPSHNLDWGRKVIAHELTHLVIHQMTLNPYTGLPTWLDEGLAMYNEGELSTEFRMFLDLAIEAEILISVRSLASPFSAFAEESYLSYAQSYSLVEFLIGNYGQDKMLELLNTFSHGSSYDGALMEVYGFDMDGLDSMWRDYVYGSD